MTSILLGLLMTFVFLVVAVTVLILRQNKLKQGVEAMMQITSQEFNSMQDSVHDDLQQMATIIANTQGEEE